MKKLLWFLLFLIPSITLAAIILDAYYDTGDIAGSDVSANAYIVETFKPLHTDSFSYVDVLLDNTSCSSGNMVLIIMTTTAGTPDGVAGSLGSGSVACTSIPAGSSWIRFTFGTPINLTAGIKYALGFNGAPGVMQWRYNNAGSYADGGLWYNNGVWNSLEGAGYDMMFRTYSGSSASPSPIYGDQFIMF